MSSRVFKYQLVKILSICLMMSGIYSCKLLKKFEEKEVIPPPFKPLKAGLLDDVVLAEGLIQQLVVKYGDQLGEKKPFGYNNSYIGFFPNKNNKDKAYLWVNHEYADPFFVGGMSRGVKRSKEQVDRERLMIGGSLVGLKKTKKNTWIVNKKDKKNWRINALKKIKLISDDPIQKSRYAEGLVGVAGGAKTPWGTILAGENQYNEFYGDVFHKSYNYETGYYTWENFYYRTPLHYGWIVEIDPFKKTAKKLTALGRFSHEGFTFTKTKNGKAVVYGGDNRTQGYFFKFISNSENNLDKGELFVADFKNGKWISLDLKKNYSFEKNL